MRGRSVMLFASVALAVAAADLAAKRTALAWLSASDLSLGEHARLVIVHNPRMLAEGWFGAGGPAIELAGAMLLLVLMVRLCVPLSAFGASASAMLGLVGGAALGNTVDLVTSPVGVTDFLALDVGGGSEVVFNLADVAAYVGAALALRLSMRLARAVIEERRRNRVLLRAAPYAAAGVGTPLFAEREIGIVVHAEGAEGDAPAVDPRRPDARPDVPAETSHDARRTSPDARPARLE